MTQVEIGRAIRKIREDRKLNLTRGAAAAGVADYSLSKWERGIARVSAETLGHLLDAWHVTWHEWATALDSEREVS